MRLLRYPVRIAVGFGVLCLIPIVGPLMWLYEIGDAMLRTGDIDAWQTDISPVTGTARCRDSLHDKVFPCPTCGKD